MQEYPRICLPRERRVEYRTSSSSLLGEQVPHQAIVEGAGNEPVGVPTRVEFNMEDRNPEGTTKA